jgi:hypothetical protein
MKHSAVVWTDDGTETTLVARIDDANGQAWTAIIQLEPYGLPGRIVANLICRSAGRYLSTSTSASLEEAKQWCQRTLQLE